MLVGQVRKKNLSGCSPAEDGRGPGFENPVIRDYVGMTGFEPATSPPQTARATKLRYIP